MPESVYIHRITIDEVKRGDFVIHVNETQVKRYPVVTVRDAVRSDGMVAHDAPSGSQVKILVKGWGGGC